MTDLPHALRGAMNKPPKPDDYLDQLLGESADEIERLRASLQEISDLRGYHDLTHAWNIAKHALEQGERGVNDTADSR